MKWFILEMNAIDDFLEMTFLKWDSSLELFLHFSCTMLHHVVLTAQTMATTYIYGVLWVTRASLSDWGAHRQRACMWTRLSVSCPRNTWIASLNTSGSLGSVFSFSRISLVILRTAEHKSWLNCPHRCRSYLTKRSRLSRRSLTASSMAKESNPSSSSDAMTWSGSVSSIT